MSLAFAILVATGGPVIAGSIDWIYDRNDLADLGSRYERGWNDNFANVFLPVLSPEERESLAGLDLLMETRVIDAEPFAFMAGGNTVIASAASLRFLEDIVVAYTWLDKNGYSTQTVADYLLMLRYWKGAETPPKPFDVLCIPEGVFEDADVADPARRAFDTAAVFVLLHEYAHVRYRHQGNDAVSPDTSRANEEQADSFAFDQFVRVGDMPIGVPILFFMMTHLMENRADYATDEEYLATLAARTHPVSPARVQSLARHMSERAHEYDERARPGATTSALAIGLQLSQFAFLLDDPDVQRLSARIGQTVRPEDLSPRPLGRTLAAPCGQEASASDFEGTLTGTIKVGTTELETSVVLKRSGNSVTGAYSYGAGFGRIEGEIAGTELVYSWTLPPHKGWGRLTLANGNYDGTWGGDSSSTEWGTIQLRK